jgi:hypothetical protein
MVSARSGGRAARGVRCRPLQGRPTDACDGIAGRGSAASRHALRSAIDRHLVRSTASTGSSAA